MTRLPHDQFAKQYLEELLAPLGSVETSREVSPEVRHVDVWFVPAPQPSAEPEVLGLLGKMASTACLFEPFRNAPTPLEILDCQSKLNSVNSELRRKARREETTFSEADWPFLWILSPSCSARLINGFGAQVDESGNWPAGVYFLPEFQKTALVAINQLPVTSDTLWLRILGKKGTQQQAISELEALPEGHPLRQNLRELLASWHIILQTSENVTEEDRELLMQLSSVYLRWREDTLLEGVRQGLQQGLREGLQEGLQEGNLQGQRLMVENLLEARFGELDEELSRLVDRLLQLPIRERTQLLLNLSNLSRGELLERFQGESE